jgi:hypothetical protein
VATTSVAPIHFDDFSGAQFERLCFAYLLRRPEFTDVEWYGQLGGDGGRDIIATAADGKTHVFQCANFQRLTKAKVASDIKKIAAGGRSAGANLTVISGGRVSAKLRDTFRDIAAAAGFSGTAIWAGPEVEERLRRDAPDLLRRFAQGVPFPELPADLKQFALDCSVQTDESIVRSLAIAFDRPAFKTPFRAESSLLRFRESLAETINTLNTGTTPSGRVLASKHDLRDPSLRRRVDGLITDLARLRATFDGFMRSGGIRGCGCGSDDCPVFMMSDAAIQAMDHDRREIMDEVHRLHPDFDPSFYTML